MTLKNKILILSTILLSSCISRLGRPSLSGIITDFEGNPIENCSVGEVLTDKNGIFTLSEIRYNQFFLTELFHMEAPPLMVSELINKKNYLTKEIYSFSSFGGGGRKGSKWNLDTIRLKKEDKKPLILIKNKWNISTNKKMDTIYFIKSNFHKICKSRKCRAFYFEYGQYSDNYLNSLGKDNLPKGVIRKNINISFNPKNTFKAEKIIQYGNKDGSWSESKPNDTIQINGEWNFNNKKIHLKSEFKELKGTYELTKFDYEYMQWTKTISNN
ncbi:MAG: hypothetical protein JKY08_08370 [Flavobacteriaceae bacterium]|nr:hypothetical protein [Flavobacteriaceae bacterium]